jgi:hypothetical protein
MSSIVTRAISVPIGRSVREKLAETRSNVEMRFYRFLNGLPNRFDDVDLEILKRARMP